MRGERCDREVYGISLWDNTLEGGRGGAEIAFSTANPLTHDLFCTTIHTFIPLIVISFFVMMTFFNSHYNRTCNNSRASRARIPNNYAGTDARAFKENICAYTRTVPEQLRGIHWAHL